MSLNGVRNIFFGVIVVVVDLITLRFEVNRRTPNDNGGTWSVWRMKGKGGADASAPPRCPPQSNTAIPYDRQREILPACGGPKNICPSHITNLLYHIFQEMQAATTMQACQLQSGCPSPYTHFQSLRHDTGRTSYKQNR